MTPQPGLQGKIVRSTVFHYPWNRWTLLTKIHLVKAMVFPVVVYGCESWTVKKAERRRIDAFELWCWRRLFRVPWTARRSNQSILKEISPGYSLEGLISFRMDWCWSSNTLAHNAKSQLIRKDPDAGKDWRQEEKGTKDKTVGWHHWLNGHEFEQAPADGEGQGSLLCCSPRGCKESDMTEWLNNKMNSRMRRFTGQSLAVTHM